MNLDDIIQRNLRTHLTRRIVWQKDRDLDSNNTLSHEYVTDGSIRVHLSGMTSLDHVTISKLHALGTLSTKLSSNDNFATLGGSFHDESDNTVASSSDSKSSQQFEFQGFGLGLSTETTVLDTLGVQFNSAIGKSESLLNDTGQFTDATSILSQHVLGAGGTDDNFGTMGSGTNFDTSVTIFGQFAGQQFIQFRVEDSVSDELSLGRQSFEGGSHGWMITTLE
mmetsp:Transcript_34612/g.83928  ORF Transcript_34612/g.83928 Transcript_34612/m.83928 type:complete len:223 (-) Transcript_34612:36-704(-)